MASFLASIHSVVAVGILQVNSSGPIVSFYYNVEYGPHWILFGVFGRHRHSWFELRPPNLRVWVIPRRGWDVVWIAWALGQCAWVGICTYSWKCLMSNNPRWSRTDQGQVFIFFPIVLKAWLIGGKSYAWWTPLMYICIPFVLTCAVDSKLFCGETFPNSVYTCTVYYVNRHCEMDLFSCWGSKQRFYMCMWSIEQWN
jgi:hypothetical protein